MQVNLIRACILASGAVKATFDDLSTLVVTPNCTAFLHVDKVGKAVQQCSQFALRSLRAKLLSVLKLRNQYCHKLYVKQQHCFKFLPRYQSAVRIEAVRWSADLLSAQKQQLLTVANDSTITLISEDRCAKLVLHPTGLRLAATWPLQTGQVGEGYWVTQSFSSADYPACWESPLRLVLAAHQQCVDAGTTVNSKNTDDMLLSSQQRVSQLPPLISYQGIECCSFPEESWWRSPDTATFPPDAAIMLEWTPDATYQYLPSIHQVEVLIHADESLLRLDRRGYAHHWQPGSWMEPTLYAPQAVPRMGGRCGSARYPLELIVAHAQALREVSARLLDLGPAVASPLSDVSLPHSLPRTQQLQAQEGQQLMPSVVAFDDRVVERQLVPDSGTFTAFADGRVHVVFRDGARLTLAADKGSFGVLLPSGKHAQAPTSRPAELQPYLQAALEFASWAAITPLERDLPNARQRSIQAQLSSTRRCQVLLGMALGSPGTDCSAADACPGQRFKEKDIAGHCSKGRGVLANPIVRIEGERQIGSWAGGTGAIHGQHCYAVPKPAYALDVREEYEGSGSTLGGACKVLGGGSSIRQGQPPRNFLGLELKEEGRGEEKEDYMLDVVRGGRMQPRGCEEREAFVEAWLRRNAMLIGQL